MAIAYRSSGLSTSASASFISIAVPSGVTNGDLLYLFASADGAATIWTTPSGWTSLGGGGSAAFETQAYWRQASSEPATYRVAHDTIDAFGVGIIAFDPGSGQTIAHDDSGYTFNDATPTAINSSRITALNNGAFVLWGSHDTGAIVSAASAGLTSVQSATINAQYGVWLGYELVSAGGLIRGLTWGGAEQLDLYAVAGSASSVAASTSTGLAHFHVVRIPLVVTP